MKSTIYEFDPVIYPFPLLVSKDFDIQELKDRYYLLVNETNVQEIKDELDNKLAVGAVSFGVVEKETEDVYYMVLIYNQKILSTGNLGHEASHISCLNNLLLGIKPPVFGEDEPNAYFTGWVVDCIESVIKNRPKSMKGKILK